MKQPGKIDKKIFSIVGAVLLVLLVAGFAIVRLALQDDPGKRKRQIQLVTLVAPPPPPPPKIEEPPPEPEEEEIIEEPEDQPQEEATDDSADEPPPGPDLGVDAEGGAGSDSFGLVGKKGGRSLIGGNGSLLNRFGWYTRIVQEELQEKIRKYMRENGGIPADKVKAIVVISVDGEGRISRFTVTNKVNNAALNQALKHVLPDTWLSEPPPVDMPRKIKLKISFKG